MNTQFLYQYRDAENFKAQGEVVIFRGEFTEAQLNRLNEAFSKTDIDVDSFIAEQIGIPGCAPWCYHGPVEDYDHPYHEFLGLEHTDQDPSEDLSVEEFVLRVEQVALDGWNVEVAGWEADWFEDR